MRLSDIREVGDIQLVTSDPDGFPTLVDAIEDAFRDEDFDLMVCCGKCLPAGGAAAARLGKGVVSRSSLGQEGVLRPGLKVVINGDGLKDGNIVLETIGMIESAGCTVVKLLFVTEVMSYGAREKGILGDRRFDTLVKVR
jgi:adenine/guanine phosphoribosyltransferase-like PRPP-binding protein